MKWTLCETDTSDIRYYIIFSIKIFVVLILRITLYTKNFLSIAILTLNR